MELIDRYLLAVRFFLPRSEQKDIVRELSEDLRSRIEDKEAERGRPLTEAEQEALIKQLGHPALLAGRYGPRRQLIGPEVFPFYFFVLRLALCIGALVQIAIAAVRLASGESSGIVARVLLGIPGVALAQFAVITLVFTAIDRNHARWLQDRWNPRSLPALGDAERVRRSRPLVQLVSVTSFAVWWLAALRFPVLIFGPGATIVSLAPVWQTVYVPILLLAVADIALHVIQLVRPRWTRLRLLMQLVITAGGLAVVGVLLKAGDLVVLSQTADAVSRNNRFITIVNDSILVTLAIVIVVSVAATLVEGRRILRGRNDHMQVVV